MKYLIEYALPIAAALLLIAFFSGLPPLKTCRLPGEDWGRGPDGGETGRRAWLPDAAIVLLITLCYAVSAFWNLGDSAAPETFVNMAGRSAVIELDSYADPEKIMLYSGIAVGSYTVEYSPDGANYSFAAEFEQTYAEVLKWHELTPETEESPRYVRVTCADGAPYLGELVFLDGTGQPIAAVSDIPELCDEQGTVPAEQSFMNSTYFDEIYHARTAWEHLNSVWPYEISHPPLGKLIIALGVTLFGMNPFGWRFMGTLFGCLMLPVMYLLLKKLFGGRAVPALGTVVFASDFMHYVQTRIATIDTYAVFFILLMYLFMYLYVSRESLRALALSGLFFGLGAASKWTCIYAGAGLAVIWAAHWVLRFLRAWPAPGEGMEKKQEELFPDFVGNCLFCVLFFVLIPCLIYYLSYYPYGKAEGAGLFSREYLKIVLDNQSFMFSYHSGVTAEHPYSSRWYQWVLDIRPILYYLHYFGDGRRSSICAFLSPALCWGGLLSLFVLVYTALFRRDKKAAFILAGYLAQLLPWVFISRITFEYHYFPSSVFLVLAIGYVFQLLRLNRPRWVLYAVPFAAACIGLFILFFPVLSGRPVDNSLGSALMGWLPTWPI